MLRALINELELSLNVPGSGQSSQLVTDIVQHLHAVTPESPPLERAQAVRGLMALNHHYYRTGNLAETRRILATARDLSVGLDSKTQVTVLLRLSEFELLTWDIGAALDHTAAAMEIARSSALRVEEARAWSHYAMALQAAGLVNQADVRLAHALDLFDAEAEPQLAGNIWSLRSQLGCHLAESEFQFAAFASEQALRYAEMSAARVRDTMASTALCNLAALAILHGDVAGAKLYLQRAAARPNLGVRPRWLIAVLEALTAVRLQNGELERAALNALLAPEIAPASAYVMESLSVMAAMYTSLGDSTHAIEALTQLAGARAQALWAALAVPSVLDSDLSRARVSTDAGPAISGAVSRGMLERLAITAELRDDATGKHCYRVGRLSMLLARRAGVDEHSLDEIDLAARLHDIGKFAIPDAIMLKPARLDDAEMNLMRTHTTIGADLLAGRTDNVLRLAELIARHHHEQWDGGGYPAGLAGESIPLVARIAALADVYDALSHVRPYKPAWSHEETINYIRSKRGTQFDPRLTDHFLTMMDGAKPDLRAFLADLEKTAITSPYVVAESRISKELAAADG